MTSINITIPYLLALFIGITIISTTGCQKESTSGKETEKTEILNIPYGASDQQKFDVHLPAGRTQDTKVIIMIHGGGWIEGDKNDNAQFVTYFVNKGYAVINMNYRLVKLSENKFPAQIEDIRSVINMVLTKKNDYVISDKLFMMGISAGAHLSLLYSYAYNESSHIKAVASISGPTDFTEIAKSTNIAATNAVTYLLGSTYSASPLLWKDASPSWRATVSSAPTIVFAGSDDAQVDPIQSQLLINKLTSLNVPCSLVVYPNEPHVWINPLNWLDTEKKIDNWFASY